MKKTTLLLAAAWMLLLWFVPERAQATLDVAGNLTQPFTIETTPATDSYIRFRRDWGSSGSTKVTINLQYRKQENGGAWGDWTTIATASTTTVAQLYGNSIALTAGTTYKLQFRGINSSGFSTASVSGSGSANNYNITLESSSYTWSATMYGNIMSLIVGYDTDNETAAQEALAAANEIKSNYCFAGLFYNNNSSSSTYPPAINAENLIFPAIYLREGCYRNMFYQYNRSDNSFKGGLNEGPCFLATDWNNQSGSHVNYTFLNVFNQCVNLKSAHFSFISCPTSDDFNSYSVYTTPGDGGNSGTKTLYAPAGFNPSSCSIGNWNHTVWSYDPSAEPGEGGGGGSSSDPAAVDVYQAATVDTTKILYDLPANAVDLGTGVAWATTDYDASTASKFAAENKSNAGISVSNPSAANVWYTYSSITPPTDWRFPTLQEFTDAFANELTYDNPASNLYQVHIKSRISNQLIDISGHGIVLESYSYYYGTTYGLLNGTQLTIPYLWINQSTAYSITTNPLEGGYISGVNTTWMMPARFVYNPSNTHTLTVHISDGTYTYKCEHGQSVTVTAHADKNAEYKQVFKWWSDDHSNTNAERTFTVDDDIEVTAVFTLDPSVPQHTATFVNYDGTQLYQVNVAIGAMPVYAGPTPTRTDWFFNGWSPAVTVMGDADITYTATYRNLESAAANVNIYQGAAADTMKILYNLNLGDNNGADGKTYKPVDMGYGVAWADRNVGANGNSATDYGSYFRWGDSNAANYSQGSNYQVWKNLCTANSDFADNYDMARGNMGTKWRMPSKTDYTNLINNSNITDNNRFTNKTDNSKYLIFPATGNYYGSTQYDADIQFYWTKTYGGTVSSKYTVYCLVRTGTNTYKVDNKDASNYNIGSNWGMTVRAIYVPAYTTYTLTINVGTKRYQYICQSGQEVTVTAIATASGYVFDQWTEDGNTDAERTFTVTDNMSYTATFKEAPTGKTIIWQDEDGTELERDENVTLGTMPSYDSETPAKDATAQYTYSFSGWSPTVVAVTDDATYTATYNSKLRSYTITFENEDGTELQSGSVSYGETPSYDGETPTKDEDAENTYTFDAWSPAIAEVTGNTTYTATFTATPKPAELHIVLEEAEDDDYYNNFATRYGGKTANTVTLNRQFEQGRWSTLCLPFEVSGGMMTTLKMSGRVYEFKYATGNANVGEGVNLYFSNAKKMEAGKGYIVNANATLAEKTSFVFSNVKIDVTADSVKPLNSATAYNKLPGYKSEGTIELVGTLRNGTLKGTESGNTYMGLKSNKIYYPNISQGSTIWAYRGIFRSSKALDIKNMQKMRIIVDGEDMGELFIDEDGEILDASGDAPSRKFIRDGVLYIEREGVVYDAQGKRVEGAF